jgi:membrane protease subunit (stomatin/prohibitin family)
VHSPEIEQAAITSANGQLEAYGIALSRLGNFDINLAPEDAEQLKRLARDTSYSQLAGGFQQYAAGEMALGAGQGMAQGGGATEGAFLAAGFALPGMMAGAMQQQQQQPPAQQAPPPAAPAAAAAPPTVVAGPACSNCATPTPAGAKFCMGCGQPAAPAVKHCTECGNELPGAAKFCANCGTRAG